LEVPVTKVDELMEDSFVSGVKFGCPGNLNKGGRWESVLEALEEQKVSKSSRFNRHNQVWQTVFQLPIIGYKIFLAPKLDEIERMSGMSGGGDRLSREERRIKQNPSQFLLYLGRYYDTSLVYSFQSELSETLQVEAPVKPPPMQYLHDAGSLPFLRSVTYRTKIGTRLHHCHLHQPSALRQNGTQRGWTADTGREGDWLEIDLGHPRYVTHLGTAGGFPGLGMFPTKAFVGKKNMRRFRENYEGDGHEYDRSRGQQSADSKGKHAAYVWVVRDAALKSWVTYYDISYRDVGSGKWVNLGNVGGNCDAFTERVFDFKSQYTAKEGLLAQHLRITPTAHHQAPVMRVAVYGRDANVAELHGEDVFGVAEAEIDKIPTVEYVIAHPSHSTNVRNGLQHKGRGDRYSKSDKDREHVKRDYLFRAVRDYSN
jgi:hypothetical protein